MLRGAVDFPTGYALDPTTGHVILATEAFAADGPGNVTGFRFFRVDPATAAATPLGGVERGMDEDSDAYYAGFHRVVGWDGKSLYRVGVKAPNEG